VERHHLQLVDAVHGFVVALEEALVTAAENLGQNLAKADHGNARMRSEREWGMTMGHGHGLTGAGEQPPDIPDRDRDGVGDRRGHRGVATADPEVSVPTARYV
jgi:hypothetical protein